MKMTIEAYCLPCGKIDFMMFFSGKSNLIIRRAAKTDLNAIRYLLADHEAVHTKLSSTEIENKLDAHLSFVVEDQVALRGFLMVETQPPQSGLIVAAAVHDNSKTASFLELVLPAVETELRQQRLNYLIQIGAADWLTRELPKYGFEIQDKIVTFEWQRQPLPHLTAHSSLNIRQVHPDDLPDLLILDQIIFGPTWHKPRATLKEAIENAASFVVGLINGNLVAYAWCDRVGNHRHGHLTRIGTHPHYQRQGIGAHLLHATLQSLLNLRVKTISLNTKKSNLRSQKLYRQFGFQQTLRKVRVYRKKIGNYTR